MEFKRISPELEAYLRDESQLKGSAQWICFPETREEAAEALAFAKERSLKVTLQGGLTGLAGGGVPDGGLILNLSHLKKMGRVQQLADGTALLEAEAGVTLQDLCKEAAPYVFPANPTENTATLGGMFATGAQGPWGLAFGELSAYAENLTWLTPQGNLWEIRRGQYVSRSGVLTLPDGKNLPWEGDLIDFLSRREGKFGISLSFTWHLQKPFRDRWGLLFFFEDPACCLTFGEKLRSLPVKPARILAAEFFDSGALKLLNQNRNHPLLKALPELPGETAVFLELEGNEEDTMEALDGILELFEGCGGREEDSWAENNPGAVERFHGIRHALSTILGEQPGIRDSRGLRFEADMRGKPDQFGTFVSRMEGLLEKASIPGAVYGHLLSCGLHCALLPETREEKESCRELLSELQTFAESVGGDLGWEYGRGRLYDDRKEDSLRKSLQKTLDPDGILSP